jgi:hypothetical protein
VKKRWLVIRCFECTNARQNLTLLLVPNCLVAILYTLFPENNGALNKTILCAKKNKNGSGKNKNFRH